MKNIKLGLLYTTVCSEKRHSTTAAQHYHNAELCHTAGRMRKEPVVLARTIHIAIWSIQNQNEHNDTASSTGKETENWLTSLRARTGTTSDVIFIDDKGKECSLLSASL
jgi:hypothetical protein